MQEDFAVTGTPTGFSDGNVTLTGYFEYDWDAKREKLIRHQIVITNLDRTEFEDTTGISYKFTSQTVDRSQIKQFEGNWPEGRGYRDTLHLIANIISTSSAIGASPKREILQTAQIEQMGDRYYEK
jgi:hypothetical protein